MENFWQAKVSHVDGGFALVVEDEHGTQKRLVATYGSGVYEQLMALAGVVWDRGDEIG